MVAAQGCFDASSDRSPEDDVAASTSGADGAESSEGETGQASGDGEPALVQACEAYCGLIDDHCGDAMPQYSGDLICQSVCERMDLGTEQDALGNTVGCRTHHAFLAARSPDPHCLHAGPTGDGTCGAPCESFCSLALRICADGLSPWADADACISDCQMWPEEPQYRADVEDDDTYACRVQHLTLAALDPSTHCGHIGPDSPVCVAP